VIVTRRQSDLDLRRDSRKYPACFAQYLRRHNVVGAERQDPVFAFSRAHFDGRRGRHAAAARACVASAPAEWWDTHFCLHG
jgi:hypothetical protein